MLACISDGVAVGGWRLAVGDWRLGIGGWGLAVGDCAIRRPTLHMQQRALNSYQVNE
jgi:hypothetical protein